MKLDNRRNHIRMDFNELVRVQPHDGEPIQVLGINYSLSGMALNGPRELPLGEFVDLRFKTNRLEKEQYLITAEVVQNRRHSNMYITGIRFLGELGDSPDH